MGSPLKGDGGDTSAASSMPGAESSSSGASQQLHSRSGRSLLHSGKRFVGTLFPLRAPGLGNNEPQRPIAPRPASMPRPGARAAGVPHLPPIARGGGGGSSAGGDSSSGGATSKACGASAASAADAQQARAAPAADTDLNERPAMPDEHSLNDLRQEFAKRNSSLFTLWSSSRSLLHSDLPDDRGSGSGNGNGNGGSNGDWEQNAAYDPLEEEDEHESSGTSGDTAAGDTIVERALPGDSSDVLEATRAASSGGGAASSTAPTAGNGDEPSSGRSSRQRRRGPAAPVHVHAHEMWHAPEPAPIVHWKRGDLIGRGAHGRVYLALSELDGALMAVKSVELVGRGNEDEDRVAHLQQEIDLMKQLNHANIVRYRGTQRTPAELNIFMDFVPGGSLSSLIQRFGPLSEGLCRMYSAQILRGLAYLHGRRVVHRDIKGANILVDMGGICKLADFGACKSLEQLTNAGGNASIRGTPYWIAPEVVRQTPYSPAADIWSVGCTVIEMATGKPPFAHFDSPVAALFHIATSKEPPALPQHLSPLAQDFLRKCLNPEPELRPSARELLVHPFVASGDRPMSAVLSASGAAASPFDASGSASASGGGGAGGGAASAGDESCLDAEESVVTRHVGHCACADCCREQERERSGGGDGLPVYKEAQRLKFGAPEVTAPPISVGGKATSEGLWSASTERADFLVPGGPPTRADGFTGNGGDASRPGSGHGSRSGSGRPPSRPASRPSSRGSGSGSGSGNGGACSPGFGVASDDDDGAAAGDRSRWGERHLTFGGGGGGGGGSSSARNVARSAPDDPWRLIGGVRDAARYESSAISLPDPLAEIELPRTARLHSGSSSSAPQHERSSSGAAPRGARELRESGPRWRMGSSSGAVAAAHQQAGGPQEHEATPPQQQPQARVGTLKSEHLLGQRLLRKGSWTGSFIRRARSEGSSNVASGGGEAQSLHGHQQSRR